MLDFTPIGAVCCLFGVKNLKIAPWLTIGAVLCCAHAAGNDAVFYCGISQC